MMKAQLMAGMALSILFSGGFMQAAWSRDVASMKYKHSNYSTAPSAECQLASDPNVRFIQAPDCPPMYQPTPSMDSNNSQNLDAMNQSWHQPGSILKQLPQEITYPKNQRNIYFNSSN